LLGFFSEQSFFAVADKLFLSLLGAFAKLPKVIISFAMSVCPPVRPSVRMQKLGSHWSDFHEIRFYILLTVHHVIILGK
jgi:hypothetical protein